jgi:hypothetical protein
MHCFFDVSHPDYIFVCVPYGMSLEYPMIHL